MKNILKNNHYYIFIPELPVHPELPNSIKKKNPEAMPFFSIDPSDG